MQDPQRIQELATDPCFTEAVRQYYEQLLDEHAAATKKAEAAEAAAGLARQEANQIGAKLTALKNFLAETGQQEKP